MWIRCFHLHRLIRSMRCSEGDGAKAALAGQTRKQAQEVRILAGHTVRACHAVRLILSVVCGSKRCFLYNHTGFSKTNMAVVFSFNTFSGFMPCRTLYFSIRFLYCSLCPVLKMAVTLWQKPAQAEHFFILWNVLLKKSFKRQ